MNLPIDREFIAQAVIVMAVCVGAWMFVAKPQAQELAKVEHEVAAAVASTAPLKPATIEAAAKRMDSSKRRLEEIEAFNQFADDSSKLYGMVMDLADIHGVQVQSLQPSAVKLASDAPFTMMEVDLIVEGQYESVAAFIDAINQIKAFIKPVSLQMTPTSAQGQPRVTAAFGCGVLSFTLGEALTVQPTAQAQGESTRGQP